jgi:hypothetical protein
LFSEAAWQTSLARSAWRADGLVYSLLNLVGAGLACYASWVISFIPFVVLEGVWAAAAAYALVRRPLNPPPG